MLCNDTEAPPSSNVQYCTAVELVMFGLNWQLDIWPNVFVILNVLSSRVPVLKGHLF
jgi:hypothetical protein